MMQRHVRILALILALGLPGLAPAQDLIPDRRIAITADEDLPGGDIASVFDTTLQACERACLTTPACTAFTYNARNGSCFVKAGPGEGAFYQGAQSGRVLMGDPAAEGRAALRRGELAFLSDGDIAQATEMAQSLGRTHTTGPWTAQEHQAAAAQNEAQGNWAMAAAFTGAALNLTDSADDWAEYARRLLQAARGGDSDQAFFLGRTVPAAVNAYLRAGDGAGQRHTLLATLGEALEAQGRGRDTVQALRLAQALQPRDDTAAALDAAIAKYGFRIAEHAVESDLARPRMCATMTEDLAKGVDLSPFVQLPSPDLVVEEGAYRQICVSGLQHGARYAITLREGLPAADGQTLAKSVTLDIYVRDRAPGVRFPGRGYVLPADEAPAVPVETVNTDRLDLAVYRVTDRNLLRAIQNQYFGAPMSEWQEGWFGDEIGERIWTGSARVAQEVNRDVTTRLPMAEALAGRPAGIYAIRAAVPGVDPYVVPAAWQWFVVSDLGLQALSGAEGVEVAVHSLAAATPVAGVEVELLSRANTPLGAATTGADGIARFAAGLARGTGSSAPAMVVARRGAEDIAFLSLLDPAFDLSDRGVAGREAPPPVDVFLATDRGAYRAGEVVHATVLARDSTARAITGLPLTAIVRRPDGQEYARALLADTAGGYVLAQPIDAAAPRGVWRLELRADLEAPPLAARTFLVEDFLPERIDVALSLPEGVLRPGTTAELTATARYLFGAPGAGLAAEGEVVLRAAAEVPGWPGYRFGRADTPFDTRVEALPPGTTDADGALTLAAVLPAAEEADRPLEAVVALRVSEGSGRPVERRLTRAVMPGRDVIGVKPLFDATVPENAEARFEVVALSPAAEPVARPLRWHLSRLETRYQWYQTYGTWNWEAVVTRTRVAEGEVATAAAPVALAAPVTWGDYELVVEGEGAATSLRFTAGWAAPADASATPDRLEMALDKPAYRIGETARLRLVAPAAGTALVTVLSNRVIARQSVAVSAGANDIPLPVSDDWGAGAYVTATVLRPLAGEGAGSRAPARALGLVHATVDPGPRALTATVEVAAEADPRGPLPIAVKVEGIAPGETAHVTLAAVDQGILNLTAHQPPDPQGHYFGQRRLGVELRDLYGRLIDGRTGALGEVRSGGDAGAQARLQSAPPTEDLVAFFSGPLEVGADGYARTTVDLPAFNGQIKVMAVAWSATGIGQASADVLVRDPVVVTASLPRFLQPGDETRLLLEIVHATGPAGRMGLDVTAAGAVLGAVPSGLDLAPGGTAVVAVPLTATAPGLATLEVALTTPEGRVLRKPLRLPVQVNDPEIARTSRLTLATGESFTLDEAVLAGLRPGTGRATLAAGPIARLDAPGLLATLDRYPYGCTEQMAARALPLLYLSDLAATLDLAQGEDLRGRIDETVQAVLLNQGAEGGFGLWGPGSGDLWLDAFVTDFLTRARAQGHGVPELALRQALANLRNQVNYHPDFDGQANGGGEGLAYALMVLAREGAAAIGDLRYYADVKGEAFATPLAQAQLGAALAAYGDQTRADAMFARAARSLETAEPEGGTLSPWRVDYGSHHRDTAGVLTLAAEAGSAAVDREALALRLAQAAGRLSTQEATWSLLAAHALAGPTGGAGLTVDGAPATGAVARLLESGGPPVVVANAGPDTTLTVTAWGVPAEPEPAGGNGYAITRSYFTLDGAPADPARVAQGDRLVAVLEVTPFAPAEARLMVDDPLPAGFEIENPNLLSGGETGRFPWLAATAEARHAEFRQDRFLAAVDWQSDATLRLAYVVRAVSPGSFHHPAAVVEDMYRPDQRARTAPGRVTVTD
jgi:hypothetical protein